MKKILILPAVSFGLPATANATAAKGLQCSQQSSGDTDLKRSLQDLSNKVK